MLGAIKTSWNGKAISIKLEALVINDGVIEMFRIATPKCFHGCVHLVRRFQWSLSLVWRFQWSLSLVRMFQGSLRRFSNLFCQGSIGVGSCRSLHVHDLRFHIVIVRSFRLREASNKQRRMSPQVWARVCIKPLLPPIYSNLFF